MNSVYVCIDEKKEGLPLGKVCHKDLAAPEVFYDISEMILKIDEVFDLLKYPEASTEHRVFGKKQKMKIQAQEKAGEETENHMQKVAGKKATFIVRIQYRQNATWQGEVVWVEKNQTKKFKSALELIKLIDGATEKSMA